MLSKSQSIPWFSYLSKFYINHFCFIYQYLIRIKNISYPIRAICQARGQVKCESGIFEWLPFCYWYVVFSDCTVMVCQHLVVLCTVGQIHPNVFGHKRYANLTKTSISEKLTCSPCFYMVLPKEFDIFCLGRSVMDLGYYVLHLIFMIIICCYTSSS